MKDANPKAIYLKDYSAPDYWIHKTDLCFELNDDETIVTSTLNVEHNEVATEDAALVLYGQSLTLISVTLNGKELKESEFSVDDELLTIPSLDKSNTLVIVTKILPQENTSLEGLYRSKTMYCTQCEAEGFRKITYYLDRPDVMSEFTTKIIADKKSYPVLLSNGNLIASGDLDEGRHFATWHDPFRKPCYLFALVAGDLACVEDKFSTMSGRDVAIKIYVESKDVDKCEHAITSLKNAMRWDEEVYGREYDLDIFMIVAVDDFNMGAMENKGLNIFNTSCVLAKPETTTDAGFQRVEGVVAHEYFHNWSGNRVTCRDWFQLSLKEGFTVFRDQEFSADMGSRTVKRVEDVEMLRTMQFAEDAGPMAHPVQPSSFIEISNFYTLTIYEKGSEIVRMIHTLLGNELFRKGSDLYFDRHDGQAVTIEDFVAAMAEVSGRDFSQFMNWYRQAATPELKVRGEYDKEAATFTLHFTQSCRPTAECEEKLPTLIPVSMGLLGDAGALPLQIQSQEKDCETDDNTQTVLDITEANQSVVFEGVNEQPVPSLLRGFSAPVKLSYSYSRDDLVRLMANDTDGFNRWDSAQKLAALVINDVMAALVNEPAPSVDNRLIDAYRRLLCDDSLDPAMVALMLTLPAEAALAEQATVIDVESIHHARNRVERKIAQVLREELLATYHRLHSEGPFSTDATEIAKRSLKNTALHYLMVGGKDDAIALCEQQFTLAKNMTDELSAFTAIVHSPKASIDALRQTCIQVFYKKWQHEALVMNSWFAVQAMSPVPGTLDKVNALIGHPAFDMNNPNKIRAVIATFASRNAINFHRLQGDGYGFLADKVIHLNETNPQIASRLITPLTRWQRYDDTRKGLMKAQLERIAAQPDLSKDVYEVVTKSLNN
ncbi:MAG: aminopeptidase N [Agarilytica sp.]